MELLAREIGCTFVIRDSQPPSGNQHICIFTGKPLFKPLQQQCLTLTSLFCEEDKHIEYFGNKLAQLYTLIIYFYEFNNITLLILSFYMTINIYRDYCFQRFFYAVCFQFLGFIFKVLRACTQGWISSFCSLFQLGHTMNPLLVKCPSQYGNTDDCYKEKQKTFFKKVASLLLLYFPRFRRLQSLCEDLINTVMEPIDQFI